MTQEEMFGKAQWLCAGDYPLHTTQKEDVSPQFPILRGHFILPKVKQAKLKVLGLGFFHCYINGIPVSSEPFLPLSTDYEPRTDYPTGEVLFGHRIYVPEFDITSLLLEGDNTVAVHFGGGWYCFDDARYGDPKVIWTVEAETESGKEVRGSSTEDRISSSFVRNCYFTQWENQDLRGYDPACLGNGFDDRSWQHAQPATPPDTNYLTTDCAADRIIRQLEPGLTCRDENSACYDCGQNLTGRPVLKLTAPQGACVTVTFSEEVLKSGQPDPSYEHSQVFRCVSDGSGSVITPQFTWFGFRAFRVEGGAEVLRVEVIHMPADNAAAFSCENESLNWLFSTFRHTVHCNMHTGLISDCPHLERRGYTGDGELTAHAVMSTLDTRHFYRKWIEDISDCQDILSGHVQYTAPYIRSGGGPGAWGCAVVEVPWQYWKHYGDPEPAKRLYPQMLRYFDYMESHSRNNLVISDKQGEWCLGDWCTPDPVALPAPFINNYYYIVAMKHACRIARELGKTEDIACLEQRIAERRQALTDAYFNTWDANFLGCIQGANAFAVDLGLGNENTLTFLAQYYRELGRYDTGICGTDVVTRVLFEHGYGDVALQLLTSRASVSFDGMHQAGATTLWEYWPDAVGKRSRNHHMFGAVTACLYDWLLGIRQEENSFGYKDLLIAPYLDASLGRVEGSRVLPCGEVRVKIVPVSGGGFEISVVLPEGVQAEFRASGTKRHLEGGRNCFSI